MEDGECYACGLWLDDVAVCPSCGAIQTLSPDKVHGPRCAQHGDRVAIFACGRCGEYGCAQCEVEESGSCYGCLGSASQGLRGRLATLRKSILGAVLVFSALSPLVALSAGDAGLAAVLAAFCSGSVACSLSAHARDDFSALGLSLMGVPCVLLIFLLGQTWLALAPLALAAWLFVQMNRTSELQIECWRTTRLLRG
jgi:hypothetical protein